MSVRAEYVCERKGAWYAVPVHMSVQINSGISVLEMHRLTDNLSSLQCHCKTTENSLTHCAHGPQREREGERKSELRQK